jgi:RNA polymerase sigma-70 factor (ECF subfamily)
MALEDLPDDELVGRIAGGDRDAFALLYRRHRANVARFALHVSGSRAVAEDVAQDVFMAVIQDAARYQPGRSGVGAWLFGIARNHVRRWAARQRPTLPLESESAARPLTIEPDPLAGVFRQQHAAILRGAMLSLPAKYREAVVLCDLHDLSYADAAAVLGCAIGTVRSRLHRGRALLARRLRGEGGEPVFRIPATRWVI